MCWQTQAYQAYRFPCGQDKVRSGNLVLGITRYSTYTQVYALQCMQAEFST